tara:strand:- start:101 stop:1678 length:1578 start_codon:yes stop_codon:yes gene_type:complete
MANITIVKLKVRRGTDSQRKDIVLDQGEVGYTLDSKRLFVGDGATYGGNVAGNVNVGPFTSSTSLGPAVDESPYLQVGDIGYANSKLYILTGASHTGQAYTNSLCGWGYIGNVPDDTFIGFDSNNKLTVKKRSIDSQYIGSTFFGDGLLSSSDVAGEASVALNTDYLTLSSAPDKDGRITPKLGSITKREISTLTNVASGLRGGTTSDGVVEELSLNVKENQFRFDSNKKLELKDLGSINVTVSSWAGAGAGTNLGGGLQVDEATNKLEAVVQSVDEDVLDIVDGVVTITGTTSAYMEMPFVDAQKGVITELKSSVYDVITGVGLSANGTDAGDGVPIGSILPHAQAFTTPPGGYLLCNGQALNAQDSPKYRLLFDRIGTVYGGTGITEFRVPNLTGGDVLLYGSQGPITDTTKAVFLSADDGHHPGPRAGSGGPSTLSAFGVNFIIKYGEDPVLNVFNGAPNQVSHDFGGKYSQQICEGIDSSANSIKLSSAGFITMSLSGRVRNTGNTENNTFDRFAIPVYSY